MKSIYLTLLLLSTPALAQQTELVVDDGMVPFFVDNRVSFFVKKHVNSQLYELSLLTVNCQARTQKRVTVAKVYDGKTTLLFKNEDDIASALREQQSMAADPDIVPILKRLCN